MPKSYITVLLFSKYSHKMHMLSLRCLCIPSIHTSLHGHFPAPGCFLYLVGLSPYDKHDLIHSHAWHMSQVENIQGVHFTKEWPLSLELVHLFVSSEDHKWILKRKFNACFGFSFSSCYNRNCIVCHYMWYFS